MNAPQCSTVARWEKTSDHDFHHDGGHSGDHGGDRSCNHEAGDGGDSIVNMVMVAA